MISIAGRYNLNFDIAAIIVCIPLLIYLIKEGNLHFRRVRSFLWIVICMLCCTVSELGIDIIRNSGSPSFSNTIAEVLTFISHVAHNSIPFLLVMYFLAMTELWRGLKNKQFAILSIPEDLFIIIHLIPSTRHLLYYYTNNLVYVRGPLYCIYYIVVCLYMLIGIAILAVKRNSIKKQNIVTISILWMTYYLAMIISMFNKYIQITNFIQMLIFIGTYFFLEDDRSMLDKETGIYNENGLERDVFPLFHSSYRSYILSLKLQDMNDYRLMIGSNAMKRVLREIGKWMLSISNENCLFYKTGHGEFAVLLYNADKDKMNAVAEQIRNRFTQQWSYSDDASLTIPAQIWVSSIPDRISNEDQVFTFSEAPFDVNLPQDQIYVANEIQDEKRRAEVNVAIRRALTNNILEVYYQPIYDSTTGTIHSCEALVRMTDPELGSVSPEEFIKVAEQTGTISEIGSIVFEKVCQFIAEKKPEQYGMDFIEVNLSPIQCMDQDLASEFNDIMKKYHVSSKQIVLEITESAVIRNHGKVNNVIQELTDAGFKFALDDFGTGQSNYSYIRDFPFSIIKIDKSFLWSADKDPVDRVVFRSMLKLVENLHLECVVEGVETEFFKDHLINDGVTYLQGYYYSKPIPEDQFIDYIKNFNKK